MIAALLATVAQANRVTFNNKKALEPLASSAVHSTSAKEATRGDTETALLLAKAQLEDDLAKQQKKKQHENEQIGKYEKEIRGAQEIVNEFSCKYLGFFVNWVYQDYCKHLEHQQIPFLQEQLASSHADLVIINDAIVTLDAQVSQKVVDARSAKAEEALIEKLQEEAETLEKKKEAGEDANAKMEKWERQKDARKIRAFDAQLQNLTGTLKLAEAELALLTEEHTGGYCVDKEQKGERVCSRCVQGKACGDTCISAEHHCWYDPGCACMASAGKDEDSFLQVDPSEVDTANSSESGESDTHSLHAKINKAKAQIREVVAAKIGQIDNLNAQLKTSLDDIAKAEDAKEEAEKRFTAEIDQEKEAHERLTKARAEAEQEKTSQLAKLEKTTQEGEKELQELVAELEKDIQKLKNDLVETEHEKTDMMEAIAASMNVLKDKHAAEINDIATEIQKIQQEKEEAQTRLDDIKSQHGLA